MAKKVKTWQNIEEIVRLIASHLYNREAKAMTVNGIKCDAVIEIEVDNIVLIEISKSDTLAKIRTDLAKFATLKQYYYTLNKYARCVFICEVDLHPSIIETAKGLNVEAISVRQFSEKLFNFSDYRYSRRNKQFGSAVNPITGDTDSTEYTPVSYHIDGHGEIDLKEIANLLVQGKYIVLTGEYGTGKSRCLKELFEYMSDLTSEIYKFPIHINLKENWGLRRSNEIFSRHIGDLGLTKYLDSLVKVSDKSSVCYLLDGFDEVGAQTWSDSPEKLKEIRKQSLAGIRDLITNSKGGCIITGREHYFKSNDELLNCLGLEKKNPLFMKCKEEFSDDEVKMYLKGKSNINRLPEWLPKKPLICQIIKDIDIEDLAVLFNDNIAEFDFFEMFLDLIAERESRINLALDKDVIKQVLINLSVLVRRNENRYGPVSINDLNHIFEKITGNTVADETAIILQRLPGLGRIDGNSHDRQFIDNYILSGLQSLSTIEFILNNDNDVTHQRWKNSLSVSSIRFLASAFDSSGSRSNLVNFLNKNLNCTNKYLVGDLLACLSIVSNGCVNFNNAKVINLFIPLLDIGNKTFENIEIISSFISILILEEKTHRGIIIKDSCIEFVEGVSSIDGCPKWMEDNIVESFQELNTLSKIKSAKLNEAQKIFIILTRKLFMQAGSARKEAALYKGFDSSEQKKLIGRILLVLQKNDFYEIIPGNEGKLYKPNRKLISRMQLIHNELNLSKDVLWEQISKLS